VAIEKDAELTVAFKKLAKPGDGAIEFTLIDFKGPETIGFERRDFLIDNSEQAALFHFLIEGFKGRSRTSRVDEQHPRLKFKLRGGNDFSIHRSHGFIERRLRTRALCAKQQHKDKLAPAQTVVRVRFKMDHYDTLQVGRQASADEIKKSFRKLAKQYHPDHNPNNKAAEEKFKKLNSAFEVLSDAKKRKLYDEFGNDAEKFNFDEAKAQQYRHYASQANSRGVPFDFGTAGASGAMDFDSILGEMFGMGGRRTRGSARNQSRPGSDREGRLDLSVKESILGGEKTLVVNGQSLTVKIPPGIQGGAKIRLAGQGAAGEYGGSPGDLFLQVHLLDESGLRRTGDDVYVDLPVSLGEAALGADIEVPIFGGSGTVTIRPGTQSGTQLRLKGRGAPAVKDRPAGDLYFVIQVKMPMPLDDKATQLIRELESKYTREVRSEFKL
jgi:curved DNA-binding protein